MILEVETVDTFYGETQALFGASLAIERAKVFALLGPNGAGKTTMLRSILGLTRPRRGAIRFEGSDVTRSPTHEIARAGIGWVPDDRRLCPTLTVARNLAHRPEAHALPQLDRQGSLRDLLAARISDGARMREPLRRRDADGGDRDERWSAHPDWCCSTNRARVWRRKSSATCLRPSCG